jgi:hypothetical protein
MYCAGSYVAANFVAAHIFAKNYAISPENARTRNHHANKSVRNQRKSVVTHTKHPVTLHPPAKKISRVHSRSSSPVTVSARRKKSDAMHEQLFYMPLDRPPQKLKIFLRVALPLLNATMSVHGSNGTAILPKHCISPILTKMIMYLIPQRHSTCILRTWRGRTSKKKRCACSQRM